MKRSLCSRGRLVCGCARSTQCEALAREKGPDISPGPGSSATIFSCGSRDGSHSSPLPPFSSSSFPHNPYRSTMRQSCPCRNLCSKRPPPCRLSCKICRPCCSRTSPSLQRSRNLCRPSRACRDARTSSCLSSRTRPSCRSKHMFVSPYSSAFHWERLEWHFVPMKLL